MREALPVLLGPLAGLIEIHARRIAPQQIADWLVDHNSVTLSDVQTIM